jgi:hypothetical protein
MFLSAAAAIAQPASFNVLGSLDGHGVGSVVGPILQAAAGGSGNASHLGRFSYTMQATVNLPTGTSTGAFVLSLSNGDVIHGTTTGQSDPFPNPSGHVVETVTITGGTGRFQGATGSLILDRLINQSTLPAFESHSGKVSGTLIVPSN